MLLLRYPDGGYQELKSLTKEHKNEGCQTANDRGHETQGIGAEDLGQVPAHHQDTGRALPPATRANH